jgi:hypothetical protein
MNPEFKRKWVEALRSGRYKQGRGVLRSSDDEFCCLGVACDLFGEEEWSPGVACDLFGKGEWSPRPVLDCYMYEHKGVKNAVLPVPSVLDKVGLSSRTAGYLAVMNDNGATFPEIADYIEEHL